MISHHIGKSFNYFNRFHARTRKSSTNLASFIDVTKSPTLVTSSSALNLFNDSIMDFLSSGGDPGLAWDSMNRSAILSFPLTVFTEAHRPSSSAKIKARLSELEMLVAKGDLPLREKFFSAAALSFVKKEFLHAGKLLESCCVLHPEDILSSHLAQSCYLRGGDALSALECVTRYSIYQNNSVMEGHCLSLLATGYAEVGRFTEAEETALRAIQATRGLSMIPLIALLSVFVQSCRSSEVVQAIEQHATRADYWNGQDQLLFFKGMALTQRGNCGGASLVCRDMLELNIKADANARDGNISDAFYVNVTLLLWETSLQSMTDTRLDVYWTHERLTSYWRNNRRSGDFLEDVCFNMFKSKQPTGSSFDTVGGSDSDDWTKFHLPNLQAVEPSPVLGIVRNNMPTSLALERASFLEGVTSFGMGRYEEAAEYFAKTTPHGRAAFAGSAVQRTVFEHTVVEALLRCGRLEQAQLLLGQRVIEIPNDAQAWRRLASVLGERNFTDLAAKANYTSWQLGIGQGGFGGAR